MHQDECAWKNLVFIYYRHIIIKRDDGHYGDHDENDGVLNVGHGRLLVRISPCYWFEPPLKRTLRKSFTRNCSSTFD